MASLLEHIMRKIREHNAEWDDIDTKIVPSAAVTDEQTAEWSAESYDRDLREDRTKRLLVLVGLGGLITAAIVSGTAVARADTPDVCASLAARPTVGTVEQLVMDLMIDGLAPSDAGEVIAISVMARCPEYRPVLQRFIDAYVPKRAISGGIGGRI